MADDIRSRAGLPPGEEAARRVRDGQARRAAAREALSQDQYRQRVMQEMAQRRAAQASPAAAGPQQSPPPRLQMPAGSAPGSAPAGRGMGGGQAAMIGMAALGAEMAIRQLVEASRRSAQGEGEAFGLNERPAPQGQFAGEEQPLAPRPAPAPVRTVSPARAAPPRRPAPPRRQELTADQLNDISLARARGEANPVAGADAAVANMRMAQRERENAGMAKGGMAKKKMAMGGMPQRSAKAAPKMAQPPARRPMPAMSKGGMMKGKKR